MNQCKIDIPPDCKKYLQSHGLYPCKIILIRVLEVAIHVRLYYCPSCKKTYSSTVFGWEVLFYATLQRRVGALEVRT